MVFLLALLRMNLNLFYMLYLSPINYVLHPPMYPQPFLFFFFLPRINIYSGYNDSLHGLVFGLLFP